MAKNLDRRKYFKRDGVKYYLPEELELHNNGCHVWCPACNTVNYVDAGFRYWDYMGFKCWKCKDIFMYSGYDPYDLEQWKDGDLCDIAEGEPFEEYFDIMKRSLGKEGILILKLDTEKKVIPRRYMVLHATALGVISTHDKKEEAFAAAQLVGPDGYVMDFNSIAPGTFQEEEDEE